MDDWASECATALRRDLDKAVKSGRIPAGSSTGARVFLPGTVEVIGYVRTPDPDRYCVRNGVLTVAGRELAQTLLSIVSPYLTKYDNVSLTLDRRDVTTFSV